MTGITNCAKPLFKVLFLALALSVALYSVGQVKITSISTTESRCLSSGSLSVSTSGAIGPTQYSLVAPSVILRGLQLDSTFGALSAGTYKVHVQDSVGNIDTQRVVIAGDYAIHSMSATTTDAYCRLARGTARIHIDTNGRKPFEYKITSGPKLTNWSGSPFFDSLSTGNYVVSVRDSCNNVRTVGFQINDTNTGTVAQLVITNDVTCDSVGFRASASGGIGPYQFVLALDTGNVSFSTSAAHERIFFTVPKKATFTIVATDKCKDSSVYRMTKTPDPWLSHSIGQNCDSMNIVLIGRHSGTNLFGSKCFRFGLQEKDSGIMWQARTSFRGKDSTTYRGYMVDTCCKDTLTTLFKTNYPPFKVDSIRTYVSKQAFLDSTATLIFNFPQGSMFDATLLSYSHPGNSFNTTGVQITPDKLPLTLKPDTTFRKGIIGNLSIINVPQGTYTFAFKSLNSCGISDTITVTINNNQLWRFPVYLKGDNRCPGFHALYYGSNNYALSYSRLTIFDKVRNKHLLLGADSAIVGGKNDSILYLKEGDYHLEHKFNVSYALQLVDVTYPILFRDTVHLKDPGFPTINGLATYGCKDSSLSIFADADLGLKPYKFRIKRSADTTWSSYRDSSSFLNLLTDSYDIEVSDQCGNFTVSSTSSGLAVTPTIKLEYACVGDTIKLKSPEFYGMNYSWKRVRDNAELSTSAECSIYPFGLTDQGMYSLNAALPTGGKVCNDTTVEIYLGDRYKYLYNNLSQCDSAQSHDGTWITSSGEYRDTFVSANGCDSVVVNSVYIGQPQHITLDTSVCDSMHFRNKWYSSTGIYFDSVKGVGLLIDTLLNTNFEGSTSNYAFNGSTVVSKSARSGSSSVEFDTKSDALELPAVDLPNELHYYYRTSDPKKGYPRLKIQYKSTGPWVDLTSIEHSSDTFKHIAINLSPIAHLNNVTLRIVQEAYQPSGGFQPYFIDDILLTSKTMSCDTTWQLDLKVKERKHTLEEYTSCDSISHLGNWFYSDTLISDTLIAQSGCDSILSTQLMVYQGYEGFDTIYGCDSVYHSSSWYKNGDERIDTLSSTHGCDSIIHWSFQLGITQHNVVSIDGCDSVYHNDTWFKQSSNYIDTLTTASMCDSIVRYDIGIHSSYLDTTDVTACDSFTHQATTYYASELISNTYQSLNGCDSVQHLNLLISPSSSIIQIDTICRYDTVTLPNGQVQRLQSSHVFDYIYQNQFQCDSAVKRYMIVKDCPLCSIYFPNAISINGDDLNEEFKQVSSCTFKYYQLRIYNRWGALIYQTEDPNAGWDGYVMDKKVPMTAYLYIATFVLDQPGATRDQRAGTVTVLR